METIKSSDFPTVFAPLKLMAVKARMIDVAKKLVHTGAEPAGRKVTA